MPLPGFTGEAVTSVIGGSLSHRVSGLTVGIRQQFLDIFHRLQPTPRACSSDLCHGLEPDWPGFRSGPCHTPRRLRDRGQKPSLLPGGIGWLPGPPEIKHVTHRLIVLVAGVQR